MNKKNIFIYGAVFVVGLTIGWVISSENSIPLSVLSTGSVESGVAVSQAEKGGSPILARDIEIPNKGNKGSLSIEKNGGFEKSRGEVVEERTRLQDVIYSAKQQSVESYIRTKFENHSDYEVVEFLQSYINIDEDDIPAGISAVDFAARLGEIFTTGIESGTQGNGEKAALIEFDVVTDSEFQAVIPTEEFKPRDKKIYASFNTELYNENKVMVKWYRVDEPKVYIFDKYEIDTEKNNNYIWLEKPSGWNEGAYGVEIYSMENNLNLMAYGEYAVVEK